MAKRDVWRSGPAGDDLRCIVKFDDIEETKSVKMCNLAVNVFSEYTPVAGYGGEPLFTLKNSGAIFTQRTLSLMMPFVAFRHQEHGNGVQLIFSKQAFNDLSEGAIAEKLGWPTKAD